MRYIKPFFESKSYLDEVIEDREDIIKTLTDYCSIHVDSFTERFWEIAWGFCPEDIDLEVVDVITNELVTLVVDGVIRSKYERECRNLIELYYDCHQSNINHRADIVDNIRDIFSEYLDDEKASFYKTSDKSDSRYVVEISKENIMTTIDLSEIMGRIDEFIEIDGVDYSGNRNYIKFEFYQNTNLE